MHSSVAMAIAAATTTATASTRVYVAGKGAGGAGGGGIKRAKALGEPVRGRPCLDSKLVQHPLNSTSLVTFITTTTTAAAAITSKAAARDAAITPGEGPLEMIPLEMIPLDVLFEIALLIPSNQDFTNLLLTSRYIYESLDTHWVRYQRFLLRFGRQLLLNLMNPRDPNTLELLSGVTEEVEDTTIASKEDLTKWYSKHSRNAVPPEEMGLAHRNGGYWKFVDDPRGPYGKVAKLTSGLSWLNVSANMHGVMPGRYWVQWGFCLTNPSTVTWTQFRVSTFPRNEIPIWHHESPDVIDYTPHSFRQFLHHTNATNKDIVSPTEALIFQLPCVLVVSEDKPTVFLQMREHDMFKSGATVLFVRIVPAGDEEADVKEERKEVEGEEDAFVRRAEGEDEYEDELVREEYGDEFAGYEFADYEFKEESDSVWGGFDDEGNMFSIDDTNDYEEDEDGDLVGASYCIRYNYFMNGGEDGDGDEVEDHLEIGDFNGSSYDSYQYFHYFVNGDEMEDNDARPYFIRMAERNEYLH
ncbi:hypothetical protein BGX24_006326 [Mortierella sp. AD032]|nr:hypothetical protein BGX24_006326 [Mortierella sp. AD032]